METWFIIYHNHSTFVSCAPLSVFLYFIFVHVRSLFVLSQEPTNS